MFFWHLSSSPVVDHWVQRIENPDASLFVYGVGNDAFEAHALPDLLGFVDSDDLPLVVKYYVASLGEVKLALSPLPSS